jgi:uncharacterized membrane protein
MIIQLFFEIDTGFHLLPLAVELNRVSVYQKTYKIGETIMQQSGSKWEKIDNLIIGIFFVVVGIISCLLSVSLLPLIGLVIGVPCIIIGVIFLGKHGRKLSQARRPEEKRE